jgi:hypothetical protein
MPDWEPYDDDPWGGRVPLMRRPIVRGAIIFIAAGSFLLVTLMSTCAPRTTPVPQDTTTTTGVSV